LTRSPVPMPISLGERLADFDELLGLEDGVQARMLGQ